MSSNVKALAMFPSESSYRHGPPLLGRVRLAPPFPDVVAHMQPSDSPYGIGLSFGRPSPSAYHDANAFLSRPSVHSRTRGASEAWELGPPLPQSCSWTVWGLPGYWIILVPRATAIHPAGCADTSPNDGVSAGCLQSSGTPGPPGSDVFGADLHAAHGLA